MQGEGKLEDMISVCWIETKEFMVLTQKQLLKDYKSW